MTIESFARAYFKTFYPGSMRSGECVGNFGDFRIQWRWDVDGLTFDLTLSEDEIGFHVPEEVDHPSIREVVEYIRWWKSRQGNVPALHGGVYGYQNITHFFKRREVGPCPLLW